MTKGRILLLALVILLVGAFFAMGLGHYLTLDFLKSEQAALTDFVARQPLKAGAIFFGVYILATTLALPVGAILTLLAGAVFGLLWGILIVSFASTIGATFSMLLARYIFRGHVAQRFERQIARIDAGVTKEGGWYLFSLRMLPLFPFFLVNLAMGVTRMRVPLFAFVSQIGMLAGTVVYVNAGTQLAEIDSLGDIVSFKLLASFTLLAVFPLVAKKVMDKLGTARVYRSWPRPKIYDRDVVVIGAGSGGLVAALIVATVKGKVTLIEKHKMGGDCLNTGCVPSKTLIRSARLAADIHQGPKFGFKAMQPEFDFAEVMERVQDAIYTIEPHDSVARYEGLGVDVQPGEAKIVSPFCVEVNGKRFTTRNIIIATGAEPLVPPIAGIDTVEYYTSDTLWQLRERPDRLAVLGGGPIGLELAQAFRRLGSQVTVVEALPQILPREDADIADLVTGFLTDEGINLMTGQLAERIFTRGSDKILVARNTTTGVEQEVACDVLLVAVGRKANVKGFGLEDLGVTITGRGTVAVDEYLQTNYPNIFAIGDVAGPYQFTHTASHMAWYAAVNALFGNLWRFRTDYRVIPWCTFVSPEVARVGISETEAAAQGLDVEVTRFDVSELDRAVTDAAPRGIVKVITPRGRDKILGVTIVAEHAGDVISEFVLAMKHGLGLGKIMGTVHIYPTWAEMSKFAAGEWRKQHKPERALGWIARYLRWRRGQGLFKSSEEAP